MKVTVYLRRIGDRAGVDDVRRRWFGDARPASTLVEVAALALDEALVEIEAVAYNSGRTTRGAQMAAKAKSLLSRRLSWS